VQNLEKEGIVSIDVLIANAGISNPNHPDDPILTCSETTMMDVFKTNCIGTMLTLQTFTPFLEKSSTKLCVLLSSRLASITQTEGDFNGSFFSLFSFYFSCFFFSLRSLHFLQNIHKISCVLQLELLLMK
jgi:NAD(P)-dependent dehydrogenase (short-subunit alcohol dehydrogenase family)